MLDSRRITATRKAVASQFICGGSGLEIAPWNEPILLPNCETRYIDVDPSHFTQPGTVQDNAETLATIADANLDFILCSHVLEHCNNPLKAIEVHLRKLRPGGYVYYGLPDSDHTTCDAGRAMRPFEHIDDDYQNDLPPVPCDQGHIHVWNSEAYLQLFSRAHEVIGDTYRVVHFSVYRENMEVLVILEKKP